MKKIINTVILVCAAQNILRIVPGLFIGQHQGGGKAEQIFLRDCWLFYLLNNPAPRYILINQIKTTTAKTIDET
jgi:hypothetical protein